MKIITRIKIESCAPAEERDPKGGVKPKMTKDGKPVFRLKGVEEDGQPVAINSLVEVKAGLKVELELEAFAIDKTVRFRAVRVKTVA